MSLFSQLKQDIRNNPNLKGRIIVMSFTFTSYFRKMVKNKFSLILCAPLIVVYKIITDLFLGCEIPASTKIGHGLVIHHGRAIVFNKNVVIGDNVTVKHNTTIGNKESPDGIDLGSPIIGNNVIIGPHTIIFGPIRVGHNAVIGAGSVVVHDVEANSVVAGNPAKPIKSDAKSLNLTKTK